MRTVLINSLALALCAFLVPVAAGAQGRVPHAASAAWGVDAGAFAPSSTQGDQLDNAPMIGGFFEYYPTARVSLRGSAGWTQPSVTGSPIDQVRMIPLRFDALYNWEGGKWHPFVEAGVGAYVMQYRRRGVALADPEARLGVSAGGGVEYFFTRTVSFKGEGRYQSVDTYGRVDPSGVVVNVGVKTYF